jgi:hypothetical protein
MNNGEESAALLDYHGVLFKGSPDCVPDEQLATPDFFTDLNLDQVVAAVIAGKEEYNLLPFFHMPLQDPDAVVFRHEIMRDLEDACLFDNIKAFADSMRQVRENLAQTGKQYCQRQNERWFLDAVNIYCNAVGRLLLDLSASGLKSRRLGAFREYVSRYVASDRFVSILGQTQEFEAKLSKLRYTLLIQGLTVEVRHYQNEPDYSAEVKDIFKKFIQGAIVKYKFEFHNSIEMNHVEEKILDLLAQLHQDIFSKLTAFCADNKDFLDPTIVAFDRDVQFYTAWLEYIARFKKAGLNFCYPGVSVEKKGEQVNKCFDLALAGKLIGENAIPVVNDFYIKGPERIIVVSGPNQSGKTTFARTFGQLHYLASLGCPVPGTEAQLHLPDRLFTHFEKQEQMTNLQGKLQDDLVRIHDILESATPQSIVIINEIFTSTALKDAIILSKNIGAALYKLDVIGVWVTFIDEMSSLNEKTVSMGGMVMPDNPELRTFKIVRKQADGLACALSIAEKHRLTYALLKERIKL